MTQQNSPVPIARMWKRCDGTICFIGKDHEGWWVAMEKHGLVTLKSPVFSPSEAIETAALWRRLN